MADNDIYNSQNRYEVLKNNILTGNYNKPSKKLKYYIKNPDNIKYFKTMFKEFEYKDLSFIRRCNLLNALKQVCHHTTKDLKDLDQDDIKSIVTSMNEFNKTTESRRNFIVFNRATWKIILPEKDSKGRIDLTVTPYIWRVQWNADKSLKKDRKDKITEEEYDKILRSFDNDTRMQLFLVLMFECLARPQEISYLNISDVTMYDNYAKIRVSKHGKEGTKTLLLIESYYYLSKWLNEHPLKHEQDAPLFITKSNNSKHKRLSPVSVNVMLKGRLKALNFDKPITNYSFKRNGVTSKYINGESPQDIQKTAGWTSTDQLKTYDMSNQEEFFEKKLIKAGVIEPNNKQKEKFVTFKHCAFCNTVNPKTNDNCHNCNRSLDRDKIIAEEKSKNEEISNLKKELHSFKEQMLKMFEDKLEKK